ncbi:MAG: Type 1 glutamine amidotransferase-like domain-containing protein [Candidatus Eremiobacteraeota bacterium]|nr:Type 1 glutamine amidotransferase-like domain-containing protein [Candidatus Eremiobacteraeota bacterium]
MVAAGGALIKPDDRNDKLERYILAACGAAAPQVAFVPTASGDAADYVDRFVRAYEPLGARIRVVPFFARTPADLHAAIAGCDVVHVGGGNTRSMLAVWRHWGFDAVLHAAYERGVLLCGSSAGSICWFEMGVTDSVAGELTAMECLGFLAGSHCPHYDGEAERRPSYQRLVASGAICDGIACDDGVAAHYIDGRLERIVSGRAGARAYRIERAGAEARELPLDPIYL